MEFVAKHGGEIFEISEKIGLPPESIIDFSSSSNPYGPPPRVLESIKNSLPHVRFYPNRTYRKLREKIASYVGVEPERIILGCGSTELIHSIFARFVRGPVILPLPLFSEYEAAAAALGLKMQFIEPRGLRLDLDEALETVRRRSSGCLVVCNPNNPTGEVLETRKLVELVEAARDTKTTVIVDEAYYEMSEGAATLAELTKDFPNLFVLRSLTKPFGFPGVRVGYGVCHSSTAEKFESTAISWRIGVLEEVAALSALEEREFLRWSRKKISSEKSRLLGKIKAIEGFLPIPSGANFFMIDLSKSGFSPINLKWRLLAYGVLVRELSSVRGLSGPYLRISVRREHENQVLVTALQNLALSLKKLYPNNPVCAERRCHREVEDCRLCFCPFYPCLDGATGGRFVEREGGHVWSCQGCSWVHRTEVAEKVVKRLSGIDPGSSDPEKLLVIRKSLLEVPA
jgi:threonine-phosphate decarboxylase